MTRKARLDPYWYAPTYQTAETKVEFKLRPLSLPALMDIRNGWSGKEPSGEGYARALRDGVMDWRNLTVDGAPVKFSEDALDDLIAEPTTEFMIWTYQITNELLSKVRPSEDLRKNS